MILTKKGVDHGINTRDRICHCQMLVPSGSHSVLKRENEERVIDHLYERDVVVCDMYDKIYKGTFLGGNLTTALQKRTKNGDPTDTQTAL